MARNDSKSFVNIEEINPIIKDADMVKNVAKDGDNNNNIINGNIVDMVAKKKPSYMDTRKRVTVYVDLDVLSEFRANCEGKKGLYSEIIEQLLIQFNSDMRKKKELLK